MTAKIGSARMAVSRGEIDWFIFFFPRPLIARAAIELMIPTCFFGAQSMGWKPMPRIGW
jgi:hypothetical protein